MLIAVPLTYDEFAQLRGEGLHDIVAYAATPELCDALGYGPDMEEDAEFAALTYASIAALTRAPHRLVSVATVQDGQVAPVRVDADFGAVSVREVRWPQVGSLFVGEEPAQETSVSRVIAGLSLSQAWDAPAVADLLESADLLWYAPSEAEVVAERVRSDS